MFGDIILATGKDSASTDLVPDYIAYYPLTGTAEDVTGNFDGTERGNTYVNDTGLGSVAYFNGADKRITIPSPTQSQTFSGSFWMVTGVSLDITVFSLGDLAAGTFRIYHFSNGLIGLNDGRTSVLNTTIMNDYEHRLVTFTVSGGTGNLYVNGVLEATGAINPDGITANSYIGGSSGSDYYNGYISRLRLYDRVLTATEITDIYEYEKSTHHIPVDDGLIAYYPLNKNSMDNYYNQYDGTDVSVTYDGTKATIGTSITFPTATGFVEMYYILNGTPTYSSTEINVFNSGTLSEVRKYNRNLSASEKAEIGH